MYEFYYCSRLSLNYEEIEATPKFSVNYGDFLLLLKSDTKRKVYRLNERLFEAKYKNTFVYIHKTHNFKCIQNAPAMKQIL
jgi:hypothetical protein